MKFLAFSAYLDRVALEMNLSARQVMIVGEVLPGVWLIHSAKNSAPETYEYLFGLPPRAPRTLEMNGGTSIILCAASDVFGFAPTDFWKWTGL